MKPSIRAWLTLVIFFKIFLNSFCAYADVQLTFYSHDFGSSFPHTFVEAKGILDNGEVIDESFGFTAVHISPSILLGSVKGTIKTPPPDYKADSNPQFLITISDSTYDEIVAHRGIWLASKKRSYNLEKRNCVHYVSEVLRIAGIKTNADSSNFKKPKSFLREVLSLNPNLTPLSPLKD